MTLYPFVQSYHDYGPARGPRLAITWHMAEGHGTVAYLSHENPNGVAVHFVVEGTGRVVQMLKLTHANGSIRPSAIRRTDDKPYDWQGVAITYGASAARAVLGEWWTDPNSATIGVEVEGYAKDGPNKRQIDAMAALYADMFGLFPGIESLAHRDFADYKQCPGHLIPWERLGGHGLEESTPMAIYERTARPGGFTTVEGQPLKAYRPAAGGWEVAKEWTPQGDYPQRFTAQLTRLSGDTKPTSLVLVAGDGAIGGLYVSTADIVEQYDPEPPADCSDAIAKDRAKARVTWDD